ncbi:MAG TPA: nucleotidyltransferase domain-containing protein [Ureibacillus sp.]|nr:nucleotidyltransferase domain-containing protein [Ureibacillus sp.]
MVNNNDKVQELETLLDKLEIVKSVLDEYFVRDAALFGSRLHGDNNLFSDLDIAIYVENIVCVIEENSYLLDVNNDSENFTHTVLDEAGRVLRRKIGLDVNLNLCTDYDEYHSSEILQYKVPLLENGMALKKDDIREKIIEIRNLNIKKEHREINVEFYLFSHFAELCNITRFYSYINSPEKFFNPGTEIEISMRNNIINSFAQFSVVTEKVPKELFERAGFPSEIIFEINFLRKYKQIMANNFNSSDLGWTVFCEDDLEIEELKLIETFYFAYKSQFLKFVLKCKDDQYFSNTYRLYENSINDSEGFLNVILEEYKERQNGFNLVFKRLLNNIM